jgi:hypothetical protein
MTVDVNGSAPRVVGLDWIFGKSDLCSFSASGADDDRLRWFRSKSGASIPGGPTVHRVVLFMLAGVKRMNVA